MSSQYRLTQRIGVGGMAEVFLGVQLGAVSFEKLVVIKRILPHLQDDSQFIQMFLDEARLAATLHHPHVVTILDLHRDEQVFLVVMEYLRGLDLGYMLRALRRSKLRTPVEIACFIVAAIADALDYAHHATDAEGKPLGIVHRDVAPSNILSTFEGEVKLIDFGVAKANVHYGYTRPGTMKGKYAYSAPELARGKPVDPRADVFSLGVVLYELLSGKRLFSGDNPATVLEAVLNSPIAPPSESNPDVSQDLDETVLWALQRDRELRTSNAAEIRDKLYAFLDQAPRKVHASDVAKWMHECFETEYKAKLEMEQEAWKLARTEGAAPVTALVGGPGGLEGVSTASSSLYTIPPKSYSTPHASPWASPPVPLLRTPAEERVRMITFGALLVLLALGVTALGYYSGKAVSTSLVKKQTSMQGER